MNQPSLPKTSPAGLALTAAISLFASAAHAQPLESLPAPNRAVLDASLPDAQRACQMRAARLYYAFWDTGDERLARSALSPDFMDRTLPPGRPQGLEGPLAASRTFRQAVPDLRVAVEEMLVVGDRVVGRLHFTGHFTGVFMGRRGTGQAVDFIATDIYRVERGQIAENWHLEDNLTLLRQLGVVTP